MSPGAGRDTRVDALRGLAVLGVFWVNQFAFAWPEMATFNALAWVEEGSAAHRYWQFTMVFGNYKFLPLLSLLFGYSLALQLQRFPDRQTVARRLAVLGALGLVHAYLIWYGDILLLYSVAGVLALLLSRLSSGRLLLAAALLYLVPALLNIVTYIGLRQTAGPQIQDALMQLWSPAEARLSLESLAYQGTWSEQLAQRMETAWRRHSQDYLQGSLWQTLALICLGMVAARAHLADRLPTRFHAAGPALVIALLASGGLWLNSFTAHHLSDPAYHLLLEPVWHDWLSLLLGGAYALLLISVLPALGARLRRGLIACGQLALSLYLLQSLLATALYYGLGLFGRPPLWLMTGLPVAFTLTALVASPLWLQRFKSGPAEWLWRTLARR